LKEFDVIVIGGGQSGLAIGYYLRRSGLSHIILDNQDEGGGAWLHAWKSLRLFSPAQWSSLPGVLMTGGGNHYPTRDTTIEYLKTYESKYQLPVKRKVNVIDVIKTSNEFRLQTSAGTFVSQAVVSATGSFDNPYIPYLKGMELFEGKLMHSSQYQSPEEFKNRRVAIIGEGNSGAQILAEVSLITDTLWVTLKEPRFLPDHIDGRYLFDAATQMYEAQKSGKQYKAPSLGDIVMVDAVKEARSRNVLQSVRPFDLFTHDALVWQDGRQEKIDAIIFCTGFKPALKHLAGLGIANGDGKAGAKGTKSTKVDGLWLVGYGNWTGFASATLIGVGRSARKTVEEIQDYISLSKINSFS
jgi:cation diffusion facilitator CzcD-associated flavoprotein CzcO